MGITVTVLAKRHIIGDGYMHDAPIGKLKNGVVVKDYTLERTADNG